VQGVRIINVRWSWSLLSAITQKPIEKS